MHIIDNKDKISCVTPGDVVTMTRLDRLARSTRDLLEIAERINDAGGAHGVNRVRRNRGFRAGLDRRAHQRRPRGREGAARKFGPRPSLSPEQIAHARQLIDTEAKGVSEVARLLGVHRATLYRALDHAGQKAESV
jgi:DNA invertase Pin-like site-specific DNA recombinase